MDRKLKLPSGREIAWEDIAKSVPPERHEEIKARFFHAQGAQAHPEAFRKHPATEAAGKEYDESATLKYGAPALELAGKAFETVVPDEQVRKVREGVGTIHDWAGDIAADPKAGLAKKVGAAGVDLAAGVGEKAMDYGTTPLDILGIPGAGKAAATVGKGLLKVPGKVWEAGKAANAATDLSGDVGKGVARGWDALKSGASKVGEAVDMRGGVLPKDYFPPDMVAGEGQLVKEAGERVPVSEKNIARQATAEPNFAQEDYDSWAEKLSRMEDALKKLPPDHPDVPDLVRNIRKDKAHLDSWSPAAASVQARRDAYRGALPRGSTEPGAQPTKPLLAEPKRPVSKIKEEPLVEPASDTPLAPASEVPQGSLMSESVAAKPGEAYRQTAKGAATEAKLRSDISKLAKGEIPVDEKPPRLVSKTQRNLQRAKQYFIDPEANVKVFSEEIHNLSRQGMDASVGKLSQATKPAISALTNNLKDAPERMLFNKLYNLRSMGEVFEKSGGKLDYGGIGSKAGKMVETMRLELLKNGKSESWNRISKAVEEFADATSKAGLEHLKGFVDEKTLAEWGEKYRYYMSFKNFDEDAVKFVHGEEGVVKHAIPSMEEFSLGAIKGRVGGEAILTDPLEAFQKSLWQKIVASHKKQVIDKAVEYSTSKLGQSLQKEFELTGGKGWGTYKTAKGDVVPMPDVIVDFLTKADKHTATVYSELANTLNPIARRGYLDLNVRYYPGMVMRDVADVFLRSPGYLTPQTEAIAKKLSKATGIKEEAPDLEYILNPAPWLRGLKASMRVNFGKWGGETDKIFEQLERQGALQTGSVQHVMRTEKLKALYPSDTSGFVAKKAGMVYESLGNIMKAWDDTIRIGNYLRNIPKEMRGMENMKKVMSMENLPGGPVSAEKMNAIVRNNHIDFKMMGDGMRDLKLLNPFLNPAIQDKFQTLEYAKKQPISFALTTSAFMAAATGSYLKWKSKPEGRLLNPKDTQRFIMVDTGIRSKSGGAYAMPVTMIPDSIQPIWLAIRNAIDVMDEKSPEFRAILKKNYAKKTAANVGSAMANISGPFVAGVETLMNYSLYLDKPIEGKYNENLSPELRAQKSVPNVFRMMGKAGISPDKAAYLTRGTLGTPGMAVAGWLDRPIAKYGGLKMPIEGSEKPLDIAASAKKLPGKLPKTMGLVREQKYDKQYEEMREFLEPSFAKDADAREVIRKYGQRFGQEKDPELKKRYLARALELYKGYVNSLDKDERARVVDFNTLFRKAIEDAAKAQATGMNRTVSGWRKRFPGATGEILGRKLETEEEQAP